MLFKRTFSVLLLLVGSAAFNSICTAAPLMVERNLFAVDRKPPSPDSADTSPKIAKPGVTVSNIQLDGVIIQNTGKKAVLRMKNQPAGQRGDKGQYSSPFVTVREGQMVSDYRVSKIESKSIALEKDGQTFTVSLFADNKVVTPPSAAPPPPPPVQQQAAAPGVAGANQNQGVQPQPEPNPVNPPQALPGLAPTPPPDPNVAGLPAPQVNGPVVNQDPNQPVETDEEQ